MGADTDADLAGTRPNPIDISKTIAAVSSEFVAGPISEEREAFADAQRQLDEEQRGEVSKALAKVLYEHHQDLASNRALREQFGKQAFRYLWIITAAVFFILILHLLIPPQNRLPPQVLMTLAGGTFASAVGLVGFVIKGLFSTPKQSGSSKFIRKTLNKAARAPKKGNKRYNAAEC